MVLKPVYVILPVYNGEQFLRESLMSLVCQDYSNLKIIVVDDASVDESWNIVSHFSSKYSDIFTLLRNEQNLGVAKSRSIALDQVPTDAYVVFLDCDDVYLSDGEISKMVDHLEQSGADLCTFDYYLSDVTLENRVHIKGRKINLRNMSVRNYVGNQAVIVKSEVFSNGLRPVARPHEDYIMWFQITLAGAKTAYVNRLVVVKRKHSNALTHNKFKSAVWHYQAVVYLYRSSNSYKVKVFLIFGMISYVFSQFLTVFKRIKL